MIFRKQRYETMPLTMKRYLDLFEGLFRRDGGNCYHAVRTANALANVTFFNYALMKE